MDTFEKFLHDLTFEYISLCRSLFSLNRSLFINTYRFFSSGSRTVSDPDSYQNQRFGRAIGLALALAGVKFDRLKDTEQRLCNIDDAKLLKWRDSYVTIFNVVPIDTSRNW